MLAVVTAFFGGLAAGAWFLGSRIERSPRPARWYAGCELVIAAWSLLLVRAMPAFSGGLVRLTGADAGPVRQWSVALLGTFALLLPATFAMGATLPAMERIAGRLQDGGTRISALYAANTFGAVIGVLVASLGSVPVLGLRKTAVACAALNVACALTSLRVFSDSEPAGSHASVDRAAMARLAGTGLLGIGYEVLVVRVISEVTEDTVYTFAAMLAVYLVGTAIGAAGYRRHLQNHAAPESFGDGLLGALAAACLAALPRCGPPSDRRPRPSTRSGAASGPAVVAEAIPALLAFGPATILMGALFSHLASDAAARGIAFSRALAVNMIGAAAAPALFGVLVLPALGPKGGLLLVVAGYVVLAAPSWFRPVVWAPAAAAFGFLLLAPPLGFVDVPPGGQVVSYEDGVMAAVSVVTDVDGVARLRIDNRAQEGSSATQRVDGRQAWLPLLLHPAPRRALFLGLGTGITASSAALDPALEVDAVELLPEVVAASARFTRDFAGGRAATRLRIHAADARRFVRTGDQLYDVIVSDNFHPARSGSGSLYTVEHFRAVRLRLEAGGLFCQWLPLHQLDRETLRDIVRSFLAVYPEARAIIASNSLVTPVLGLVARRDGGFFDVAALRERLARVSPEAQVAAMGFEDDLAVLGSFVAASASLAQFAGDGALNTDDLPVVAYRAPRATYAPESNPGARLVALLGELAIEPRELVARAPEPDWSRRLEAYWTARDRFVESGRDVRPSPRVVEMLAQVREPLLAVLRISPDFRPRVRSAVLHGYVTRSERRARGARAARRARSRAASPRRSSARAGDDLGRGRRVFRRRRSPLRSDRRRDHAPLPESGSAFSIPGSETACNRVFRRESPEQNAEGSFTFTEFLLTVRLVCLLLSRAPRLRRRDAAALFTAPRRRSDGEDHRQNDDLGTGMLRLRVLDRMQQRGGNQHEQALARGTALHRLGGSRAAARQRRHNQQRDLHGDGARRLHQDGQHRSVDVDDADGRPSAACPPATVTTSRSLRPRPTAPLPAAARRCSTSPPATPRRSRFR